MFEVRVGSFDEARVVEARIAEFGGVYDPARFEVELSGVAHLCLVALDDAGALVGYKVGYALSPTVFRSWFGGVVPAARRQGVATALRVAQEEWARQNGFERIRVGSKNQFPDMLRLLIGAGYEIVEVEDAPRGRRIIFERDLTPPPASS
jgi:GNAT superfamily N-acetyltransferase